jgi:hypothetical protein
VKKIIILLIVGAIGWQAYGKYQQQVAKPLVSVVDARPSAKPQPSASPANYRCDGRTHCSHMTSCEEATWFLRNCPGTKMDGNNDGIPCERQWCK